MCYCLQAGRSQPTLWSSNPPPSSGSPPCQGPSQETARFCPIAGNPWRREQACPWPSACALLPPSPGGLDPQMLAEILAGLCGSIEVLLSGKAQVPCFPGRWRLSLSELPLTWECQRQFGVGWPWQHKVLQGVRCETRR